MDIRERKLAIIGLGYVGLPLAIAFGKNRPVMGFDLNVQRIHELKQAHDSTHETSNKEIKESKYTYFTTELQDLSQCDTYIITVPTPIDTNKQPDLSIIINASKMLAPLLNQGDIVIYESTVYPGATEEVCVPVLEQYSALKFNENFFIGYSPERINPGDKKHSIAQIKKITSGSTLETATIVDTLYQEIIVAGTHKVSSIKVAEAAKVIENTQRDLNIALTNELSIIFHKLDIDTEEVLKAAETKWNFSSYRPGLVGGHCIGIDPYYLTYKANAAGYHPEIILAGRRLNDNMGYFAVSQLIKSMLKKRIHIDNSNILIMGLSFKENCSDIRNTRVYDMITELQTYNINVDVFDPIANKEDAQEQYDLSLLEAPSINNYDAIILAVAHQTFKDLGIMKIRTYGKDEHVVYDLKYLFSAEETDIRL